MLREAFRIGSRRCFSYKSVRRPNLGATSAPKAQPEKTPEAVPPGNGSLAKQLRAKILATGQITVAEYMREVLTNPQAGYYMNRDVFGREGDFITSPEISQIFGELVGIWLVTEWRKMGSPSPFQLVELGPGRGTLARDVLKILTKFKLGAEFSMHMVEISPYLSKAQAQRFCYTHNTLPEDAQLPHYQVGTTATGTKAYWHRRLEDIPEGFSLVLAHEYFDALPVHKLQLDNGQWQEVLIDVAPESEPDFRYVLSKSQTPVSRVFQPMEGETRATLEYSLETERQVGLLADRIERNGGIGLIMDYGHFGDKTDTFRAFKQHALHEPLLQPGTADLTADVDFKLIKQTAEARGHLHCCGPIEQGLFLSRMQGEARLEQLLANALPENETTIRSGYEMLTADEQMGKRFKFLAMFPGVLRSHLEKFPVAGF
ncbi:protein arginine methyltransferase NDUFAF7 homolog, mitochondrial [Drosophila guanche]|uniref:Protein arginine methyltransferase NDUFAF7 n=1 Tax=Drosophila guanche TaxID=7266 RepID=A0A3B0KBC8_DROGU|nr:protein arginine methyltransferase NDUFAF7 homolog, mitochondrial [Drosophila guanche]SPP83419.1 blast:NADH dehydrogenase [Drosophila guanche]